MKGISANKNLNDVFNNAVFSTIFVHKQILMYVSCPSIPALACPLGCIGNSSGNIDQKLLRLACGQAFYKV